MSALSLAKPGWDGATGSGVDFAAQTEGFVEAAFTFPTRRLPATSAEAGGALAVEVVPEFLPERGALLLSMDVARPLGDPVKVRCVVRYAKLSDGTYRYDVVGEGGSESAAVAAARAAFARRAHAAAPEPVDPMQGGGFGPVFPAGTRPVSPYTGWAHSTAAPDGSAALVVRVVEPGAPVAAGAVAVAGATGGGAVAGAVFYRPLEPDNFDVPVPNAFIPRVAVDRFGTLE